MQPLIVLVGVFAMLFLHLGWWTALRIALAVMFLLTASAHWGKRRADLIRMVPAAFSRPDLLVTITGVCEIAGAVGAALCKRSFGAGWIRRVEGTRELVVPRTPYIVAYTVIGDEVMILSIIHSARRWPDRF